ncbi:MAG: hypothetical protein HPY45_01845 [Anaerolineae bacterium]|nr:hypothetical protein [Anaerolineae bacterium]
MPDKQTLSPKQRKAIEALVGCANVSKAAEVAGVSRDTLYRWSKLPHFQAALEQSIQDALSELSRALVSRGNTAVETIGAIMTDRTAIPAVRLRAAETVLANILRLREQIDIEQRVSKIERLLQEVRK